MDRYSSWTASLAACVLLMACTAAPLRAAQDDGNTSVAAEENTARVRDALAGLKNYSHGDSREPARKVMRLAHESAEDATLRHALRQQVKDMLHGDATVEAKEILCEALALAGTAEDAPALVKLLDDEELSFHARAALARIPGPEVDARLRAALSDASGQVAAGIISTLGRRRDVGAVEAIAARLGSEDSHVAAAAVRALGRMGTWQAARALRQARPDMEAELQDVVDHALLLCAEKLQNAVETYRAARLYGELRKPGRPTSVRAAAVEGLLACTDLDPAELLRGVLQGKPDVRDAVLHRLDRMLSEKTLRGLLDTLTDFPASVQVTLIRTVARQELEGTQDALSAALDSSHASVRTAALNALGNIGDASAVPLLAEHLDREVARRSLVRLRGKNVNDAIIDALEDANPSGRRHLAQVLVDRGATSAVPALLRAAQNGETRTQLAAFRALGKLGTGEDLPEMIRLLKSTDENMRGPARQALMQAARRADNHDEAVQAVLEALPDDSGTPHYRSLLHVLGELGGPDALEVVTEALGSASDETADTALDVLADWPDGSAVDTLLRIARSADSPRDRLIALRGFARVAPRAEKRSADELTDMFADAFEAAETAQARKALLGSLSSAPTPGALELARGLLDEEEVRKEAVLAVLQLSETLGDEHRAAAVSALHRLVRTTDSAETAGRAISALQALSALKNLAADATASSPDGLEKDGSAGGDAAGIDGDTSTYWDEENNEDLYRYRVTFPERRTVSVITLVGYQHENFAPRDFTILCDGEEVKQVRDASYDENRLLVRFEPARCKQLELKITDYYGKSPAIRELGIYHIPE
ncbi:MAG: HEAT repeat domain-containing protein [Planctomycetota bacterium]